LPPPPRGEARPLPRHHACAPARTSVHGSRDAAAAARALCDARAVRCARTLSSHSTALHLSHGTVCEVPSARAHGLQGFQACDWCGAGCRSRLSSPQSPTAQVCAQLGARTPLPRAPAAGPAACTEWLHAERESVSVRPVECLQSLSVTGNCVRFLKRTSSNCRGQKASGAFGLPDSINDLSRVLSTNFTAWYQKRILAILLRVRTRRSN